MRRHSLFGLGLATLGTLSLSMLVSVAAGGCSGNTDTVNGGDGGGSDTSSGGHDSGHPKNDSSSGSGDTGSGGSGDTGSGGSGDTGSGGSGDTGAGGGDSSVGPCTGKDCCGTATCKGGESCCANVTAMDASAALTCSSSCSPADVLDCTHATDCSGSDVCCVTAVFKMGAMGATPPGCLRDDIVSASSSCVSSCAQSIALNCNAATDHVQLCTTSADCTDKSYPACCDVTLGGETYSGCLPGIAKLAGLTCH